MENLYKIMKVFYNLLYKVLKFWRYCGAPRSFNNFTIFACRHKNLKPKPEMSRSVNIKVISRIKFDSLSIFGDFLFITTKAFFENSKYGKIFLKLNDHKKVKISSTKPSKYGTTANIMFIYIYNMYKHIYMQYLKLV